MNNIITNKVIPEEYKLKYLICIPCVNRTERNALNIIDKTFEGFEKAGMFESDIDFDIILFESGSVDKSYLDFIQEYKTKYKKNIFINESNKKENANTNTYRMFLILRKIPVNYYDFIIWMDDDVFVCQKFIENADAWIKKYANFSFFSSLYVPYRTYFIKGSVNVQHADLSNFYGTCCTIFKQDVVNLPIQNWFWQHFELFNFNPDARFRDCIRRKFNTLKKICVSFPSLVQHMNIGSSIYNNKNVNKGHKCNNFVGVDVDPKFYENIR